jgi:hypothetical protein
MYKQTDIVHKLVALMHKEVPKELYGIKLDLKRVFRMRVALSAWFMFILNPNTEAHQIHFIELERIK